MTSTPSERLHDVLDALRLPRGPHPVAQCVPACVDRLTVCPADEDGTYHSLEIASLALRDEGLGVRERLVRNSEVLRRVCELEGRDGLVEALAIAFDPESSVRESGAGKEIGRAHV